MIGPINMLRRVASIFAASTDASDSTIIALASARETVAIQQSEIDAIRRVRAMIEYELDGTIRFANPNFLKILGYTLAELTGRPHSILVRHPQPPAANIMI
jgi:PAS domain-containing protein